MVEGPTDAALLQPAFNALLTRHDVCDEEFHYVTCSPRTEFLRCDGFWHLVHTDW